MGVVVVVSGVSVGRNNVVIKIEGESFKEDSHFTIFEESGSGKFKRSEEEKDGHNSAL